MINGKSLLESLVKSALTPSQPQQQPQAAGGGGGGLADILGQILQGGAAKSPQGGQAQGPQGGGLEDILRNMLPGAGQGAASQAPAGQSGGGLDDILRRMAPSAGSPSGGGQPQAQGGGGGLGDILGQLGKMAGGQGGAGGGLMDILGQVLSQAGQGVKEGAQRIDQSTGASTHMRDAIGKATGQNPDDLLAKLKELIEQNKTGAAATAGGLGGLVLGTRTGRSAAATAAKLGALVMIGGLAYKAYQNYSQGRPILDSGEQQPAPGTMSLTAAPTGSGFEPDAITSDSALLYVRAMIGAAAADGRIDPGEQSQIMGGLQQAGMDQNARAFIQKEIQNPATPEQLAAAVSSPEEAVQVFTAARIAVDVDSQDENDYLVDLAQRLGLDGNLVAHIDAEASRLKAAA